MRAFLFGLLGGVTAIVIVAGVAIVVVRARMPDRRAALLVEIQGYQSTFGDCLVPQPRASNYVPLPGPAGQALAAGSAQLDQSHYNDSQVYLRQHPELDKYVTWETRRDPSFYGSCMVALRQDAMLTDYIAGR